MNNAELGYLYFTVSIDVIHIEEVSCDICTHVKIT